MSEDTYSSLLRRAQALVQVKRFDDALPLLAQAIAIEPGATQPRCLLAQALLSLDRPDESREAAEGALALDPEEEWAHRVRALALAALDRPEEALSAAEEAVRIEPELPATHLALAHAACAAFRWKTAEAAASRARALDPDDVDAHVTLSAVAIGRGRWRDAEQHARAALAIDPEDAAAYNNLGVALLRQGRRREAVHYLASSSQLDPTDPTASRNALLAAGLTIGGVLTIVATSALRPTIESFDAFPDWVYGLVLAPIVLWELRNWWKRRREGHNDPKASKELMRRLRREKMGRLAPSALASHLSNPVLILIAAFMGFLTIGFLALLFDTTPTTTSGDRWMAGMFIPLCLWPTWKSLALVRRRRTTGRR